MAMGKCTNYRLVIIQDIFLRNNHKALYRRRVLSLTHAAVWIIEPVSAPRSLRLFFWWCRWEDLAVGAPQFFVKDGSAGGAVYVFINNHGQDWEETVPTRLEGQKDSMFGLAVENVGDLNQDGCAG